jgi:hypothetical protein
VREDLTPIFTDDTDLSDERILRGVASGRN